MECDFKKEVREDILRVCKIEADQEYLDADLEYERMFKLLLEEVQRDTHKRPTKTR